MPAGSKPGERRGGRQKGSPNTLPDLRAITLKALMKAGGVEYLTRQAAENPGPFLGLLGKVMPREATVELTGELRIRQEVRRDLVEKVLVLMAQPSAHENTAIEGTANPLPAIAHQPDTMLKAQRNAPRESLSRATENARAEGSAITTGITQRAATMHREASERREPQGYAEQAIARIDGLTTPGDGERVTVRPQRESRREASSKEVASRTRASPGPVEAIPPGVT